MTDIDILNLFVKENGKLLLNYLKRKWLDSHSETKNYLDTRYKDLAIPVNYSEIIYRIKNNIDIIPKCIMCGKPALFKNFSYGYREYCSYECSVKSEKRSEKFKETYKEKYSSYSKELFKSMYGWNQQRTDKAKNTCLEKYGYEYAMQSEEVKEKMKQTCINNFGQVNPNKCDAVRNKIELTNLSRYGNKNAMKSDIIRLKQSEIQKSEDVKMKKETTWLAHFNETNPTKCKDIIDKVFSTKKKHNSCNTSKYELYVKDFFEKNNISYELNYKSDLYPFHCDFYLHDFNLYIELNINWTHGYMPYNENDIICQTLLLKWVDKSESSNYYKDAIKTWTVRDVEKRNTANKNKLNYLEIFSNDIKEIISIITNKLNFYKNINYNT